MKYLTFIILIFGSVTATAEIQFSETYTYYVATASSKSELAENLKKASPIKKADGEFAGSASIAINWSVDQFRGKNSCKNYQANVSITVMYTMPKVESSNQEVQAILSVWYPLLLRHEFGHKDIGIEFAHRIEKEIMALKSERTCDELTESTSKLTEKIVNEYNEAQSLYDLKTDYGSTQGSDLEKIIENLSAGKNNP